MGSGLVEMKPSAQHKADSILEALVNQSVGFVVAMFAYAFIINPLFGLKSSPAESFWIVSIFTVISVLRSYVIRRVFNGKNVYAGVRDWTRSRGGTL